ncbi:5699_t:CDS:1 [Paraglomus brasilianum]|uniref:5699_t:CDS:1 n=1 Tax=Paraglomus brasilianum TaxID=144538 RepID=A0A9N8ZFF6_9GLOM|nr:5699_t:CDS:1 [Paraglomus brasilianum]
MSASSRAFKPVLKPLLHACKMSAVTATLTPCVETFNSSMTTSGKENMRELTGEQVYLRSEHHNNAWKEPNHIEQELNSLRHFSQDQNPPFFEVKAFPQLLQFVYIVVDS